MESENIFTKIYTEFVKQSQTQEPEQEQDQNQEIVFNKEQYTKFYDLFNITILFFLLNTYETLLKKNYESDTNNDINTRMSNMTDLKKILQMQLNICWSEYNSPIQISEQLFDDLDNLLNYNIIKHKMCLFKLIKNTCIYIISDISKINFTEKESFPAFKERIAKIIHAMLIINKISGLEDEDEFDCDSDCNINSNQNSVFWE